MNLLSPNLLLENNLLKSITSINGVDCFDFGLADFETVYALQKQLVEKRIQNESPDTLLIGEHLPVFTLGRGQNVEQDLLSKAQQYPIIQTERGGRVTYHGPNQLVLYPIIQLQKHDLHLYLRVLEEALIELIDETTGLKAQRDEQGTGVWVNGFKVASIGVAAKKWVVYHGVALNLFTDLTPFGWINPCGLDSNIMRNLNELLPASVSPLSMDLLKPLWLAKMVDLLATKGLLGHTVSTN